VAARYGNHRVAGVLIDFGADVNFVAKVLYYSYLHCLTPVAKFVRENRSSIKEWIKFCSVKRFVTSESVCKPIFTNAINVTLETLLFDISREQFGYQLLSP